MLDWFNQDGFFPITIDGKSVLHDQGVTNQLHAPEGGIQTTAHEMGHLLYGYFHHAGIGLNIAGFNAYERWLMGWINPRHVDTNQSGTDLNDFITTGDAIRIPTPDSTEYFLVENHQKLNAYETFPRWHGGPPQFGGDPGLYVFHVDEKIPEAFESTRLFVELASGRYDWRRTTCEGSQRYTYPFQIIAPNIASGVTSINLPFSVCDAQSGTRRTLSDPEGAAAGIHGNQYDTFHEGFKTEFSYATNPATNLSGGNQNGSTLTSIAVTNIRRVSGTNFMAFDLQLTPPNPTLASPSSGATGISTSPTLSWNPSTGATSYQLQVSTDEFFSTTVYNESGITATSRTVPGLGYSTSYYWHVSATNAAGPSGWSSTWAFTTESAPLQPPPPPTLASPSNGAIGISTSPTLSWNASSGATSYQLQVSTVPNFSTTVLNQSGITSTSYPVTGLANSTTYYWRVNATGPGGTSSWSATWSFTTQAPPPPPPAPTLLSPANGATGVSTSPTLSWNASSGATSYRLQVSTVPNFSTTVLNQSGITSTSYVVTGLSNSTGYYWRANASNGYGTSAWSEVWSFITVSAAGLPPPTLLSPANGATGVSASPTLSWNASSGATSYRLQMAVELPFSKPVRDQSGITDTSYSLTLWGNTTFYWHVWASGGGGNGDWSETWSFTTAQLQCSPLVPPWLSGWSPSYGRVDLVWGGASAPCGVAHYRVCRRSYSGGYWSQVAFLGPGVTSWTDYPPLYPPYAYLYRITVVDNYYNESVPSSELLVYVRYW